IRVGLLGRLERKRVKRQPRKPHRRRRETIRMFGGYVAIGSGHGPQRTRANDWPSTKISFTAQHSGGVFCGAMELLEVVEDEVFSLQIPGYESDIDVISFRGREAVSRPYLFRVRCSLPADASDFERDSLGKPACLTFHGKNSVRRVIGIAKAITTDN